MNSKLTIIILFLLVISVSVGLGVMIGQVILQNRLQYAEITIEENQIDK